MILKEITKREEYRLDDGFRDMWFVNDASGDTFSGLVLHTDKGSYPFVYDKADIPQISFIWGDVPTGGMQINSIDIVDLPLAPKEIKSRLNSHGFKENTVVRVFEIKGDNASIYMVFASILKGEDKRPLLFWSRFDGEFVYNEACTL